MTAALRILLGPQRPDSNIAAAVAAVPDDGKPLATISAGWQEAEADINEVRALAGRPLEDLQLYGRAETLFEVHPELREAYRIRQDRLIEQQRLYRLRLRHLMVAARQVLRDAGEPALLAAEQRHAIAQLRALDRHHLNRVESIHAEFEARFGADTYAPLGAARDALARHLDASSTVLITGGNVIVLLNRLQLFGLGPLLQARHIIAWSAGAMALTDRIVLYHDRLPQGRRDPELLGPGLGVVQSFVFLADARRRLRAKDPVRLSALCRRFAPATCALLDPGSLLQLSGGRVTRADTVRRVKPTGAVGEVRPR